MATYLPVRALNRSARVRVGGQTLSPTTTSYVDISDGKTRKELASHQAIGQIVVVGGITATNSDAVVTTGGVTTAQGTPDQTVAVSAGELRNRSTGVTVAIGANAALAATAAHGSLGRLDIVQVNTTTGVVSYKAGTAASTPVAPSPDAGNIAIARTTRAANDNAISTGEITDVRPRP